MGRISGAFALAALVLAIPSAVKANDDAALRDVLALQSAVQAAIRQAEPSVVCILVSRSEDYRQYGLLPSAENPGRLGEFYAERVAPRAPGSDGGAAYEKARKLDLSDPDNVPESYGSGVILEEKDRLILTNYHVVQGATKVYVRLPSDKGSYANIHAADPRSDLAVLQLIDMNLPVKAIKLGDASTVGKGQFVVTLANPFAAGFRDGSPSASWGIISNVRRRSAVVTSEMELPKRTLAQFSTLLEVDARLNLGCSGGALLNLHGEMIGLTNSLAALAGTETPGGFALPMEPNIKAILDVLKRGEEVEYGFLGVNLPRISRRGEVFQVGALVNNSPAERAGIRQGDYILSINGTPVHDKDDVWVTIGTALAGSRVRLEVARSRRGPVQVRMATLAKSFVPGNVIASRRPEPKDFYGLRVDYTSILTQRLGIPIPDGVMIRDVQSGSPADLARLQPDKVILQVNGRPVNSPDEFYREMRHAASPVELTLAGLRGVPERVKLQAN